MIAKLTLILFTLQVFIEKWSIVHRLRVMGQLVPILLAVSNKVMYMPPNLGSLTRRKNAVMTISTKKIVTYGQKLHFNKS